MTNPAEGIRRTRIAAVIVNWNAGRVLAGCLESLAQAAGDDVDLRVVVVDNASTDGSAQFAATVPGVQFVQTGSNLGFAPAVNIGVRQAGDCDAVLLLNPDARLADGCLAALIRELDAGERVGVVGPRILGDDGRVQVTCARSDWNLRLLGYEVFGLRRAFPRSRIFGGYRLEYWDHLDSADVPCLSGACVLIRRQVLAELGGLDESIPMYFEDMDLCYRARRAGWRVRYAADAVAHHIGAHSSDQSPQSSRLAVMEQGDARWLFFRRHRGRSAAAAASAITAVGSAFRVALVGAALAMATVARRPTGTLRPALSKYLAMLRWAVTSPKPRHRSLDG